MEKFDRVIAKILKQENIKIDVSEMIKASEKSLDFLKKMKRETIKSNKINNKAYNLNLKICHFEVYLFQPYQLMYSVFDTPNNEIIVYDNMKGSFIRCDENWVNAEVIKR